MLAYAIVMYSFKRDWAAGRADHVGLTGERHCYGKAVFGMLPKRSYGYLGALEQYVGQVLRSGRVIVWPKLEAFRGKPSAENLSVDIFWGESRPAIVSALRDDANPQIRKKVKRRAVLYYIWHKIGETVRRCYFRLFVSHNPAESRTIPRPSLLCLLGYYGQYFPSPGRKFLWPQV